MQHYIALIHKETGSDYGVSFPDLPGCVTAGTTLDEARSHAEEALALHLAGLAEDGEHAAEPSTLNSIMRDVANSEAVAVLLAVKWSGVSHSGLPAPLTLTKDESSCS